MTKQETTVSPEDAESARAALDAMNSPQGSSPRTSLGPQASAEDKPRSGQPQGNPAASRKDSRADSAGDNVANREAAQDNRPADDADSKDRLVVEALALSTGGVEELHAVVDWGRANLSKEDRSAFDEALDQAIATGQLSRVEAMIAEIKSIMPRSQRDDGPGQTSAPTQADLDALLAAEQQEAAEAAQAAQQQGPSAKPFANRSDMIAAINDPRYARDPEYSRHVQARIAVSDFM